MKWFENWLFRKVNSAAQRRTINVVDTGLSIGNDTIRLSAARNLDSNGMSFTVFRANGGYVIQYSKLDPMSAKDLNKLHIVTSEKDLGAELGKIISFEALRN